MRLPASASITSPPVQSPLPSASSLMQQGPITKGVIKKGQTLGRILRSVNVSHGVVHDLSVQSKGVFDLRKIRVGKPYTIVFDANQKNAATYFIYQRDATSNIVFDLNRARVYIDRKTVEVRRVFAKAVINRSINQALIENQIPLQLAWELADIFSCAFDFHRLQKGDSLTIIYEEKYIDDKRIGAGNVLAARFNHDGQPYYAFHFNHNGQSGYYDENANSLEQTFLKAPLKYSRISSTFSKRRMHPILHKYKPHYGIDYAAPIGTPVMAVSDGIVRKARYNRTCGRYIEIRHGQIYETKYLHLARFARGIKPGAKVQRGDVIGYVGSSGLSTGPHLDFRMTKKGHPVDPLKQHFPTAAALSGLARDQFQKQIYTFKSQLY